MSLATFSLLFHPRAQLQRERQAREDAERQQKEMAERMKAIETESKKYHDGE